jgi:glycoside/pentoside/hexuronide:cation symporter, GPH family
MNSKKLSVGVKLGYGICDFGGNLFFTATAFVLMIYITDTMGLKAGLAGTALFIGRIWDAFYDTIIGYISDKTSTRLGRRRPFMLAGAVPLCIAMILMFTNPALFKENLSQTELFIFTIIVYIFLCTSYSTVNIPYCSMTPELTDDYHERTSLTGYRFGFAAIGTLMGAGAAWPIVGLMKDKNMGFILLGAVFGGIMMVTALITVFTTKEPAQLKPARSMGFIKTYLEVFKNKPYLLILSTYILHIIAITIVSQVAAYYFDYVLAARNVMNPKDEITKAMLILIGTAFLFIPVSVFLSKKLGKKLVYGIGFVIMSAGLVALFMFGDKKPVSFTMIMMLIMGVGLGLLYVPPFTIVADAIEYGYLQTGERKEGSFFGIWTWGLKLGQALAALSMGWILQLMGYVKGTLPQTPSAELGIRLLLGPISAAVFILATLVLCFYPITEKRYSEIQTQIKEMEAAKAKSA